MFSLAECIAFLVLTNHCSANAQVMIGFEETQYTFRENGDSNTFNVSKRGMNIRDIMVFISPLDYSEFMNMELPEPLIISQPPSSPAEFGSDIVKEQYNVTFPASTSGRVISQQVTIHMIDDGIPEPTEGFYLFITNYVSLNHSNSTDVSDDVELRNRVALVRIFDDDDTLVLSGLFIFFYVIVTVIPTGVCVVFGCICYCCGRRTSRNTKNGNVVSAQLAEEQKESHSEVTPKLKSISVQSSYKLHLPPHLLIHASNIKLLESIGQGEFGIVYRGHIIKDIGTGQVVTDTVAIKTLKGLYGHSAVRDMLKECTEMYNFNHLHILTLKGVCLDGGPAPYIIMPFMANGSLLVYLKENRDKLVVSFKDKDEEDVRVTQKQLMDMCIQIAKGMEYLASKKVVHRDLAARNCMIDMNFVIKVADFGLAENTGTKDYYREAKNVKLPLRWMAPESMGDYIFSEKSDVWAYGVTCWEVFTGGKVPYGGVGLTDLCHLLATGHRLEKPANDACSCEMYDFMLRCWEFKPEDRPRFADLLSSISMSLGTMAGYIDVSAFGDTRESSNHGASSQLNDTHSLNDHSPHQTSCVCECYDVKSDLEAPATPTASTIAISSV